MNSEQIISALNWRYAVKVFDTQKPMKKEDLMTILESARLAPSSTGLEAWKFIVIENKELRAKLREVSYGQPKVTDAPYFVVMTYRTDVREHIADELVTRAAEAQKVEESALSGLRQMAEGGIAAKDDVAIEAWVRAQTYIPLGIMIETAALLGIDSGPMEGFDNVKVDELLDLRAKNLKSTSMIGFGYRGEDPAATRAKVRRAFDEVIEFMK